MEIIIVSDGHMRDRLQTQKKPLTAMQNYTFCVF